MGQPLALGAGSRFLLLLFLVIWAGDICAYLVGRPLGRTPFFARISPRKTWEGALAGLAGSLLAAWAFAHWFWKTADVKTVMLLAAWIAVAGQVGDLVESAIKRGANQKDSGTLLPGHGGFLDRIDSLLFAAPALWLALFDCYGAFLMTQGLCILGSTGSIGQNCLRVVDSLPDRFHVVALSAGKNLEVLAAQVVKHHPRIVVVSQREFKEPLRERLKQLGYTRRVKITCGVEGQVEAATHDAVDFVVSAVARHHRPGGHLPGRLRRQARGPGQQGDPGGRRGTGDARRRQAGESRSSPSIASTVPSTSASAPGSRRKSSASS